jgi:hypothetical protein
MRRIKTTKCGPPALVSRELGMQYWNIVCLKQSDYRKLMAVARAAEKYVMEDERPLNYYGQLEFAVVCLNAPAKGKK